MKGEADLGRGAVDHPGGCRDVPEGLSSGSEPKSTTPPLQGHCFPGLHSIPCNRGGSSWVSVPEIF